MKPAQFYVGAAVLASSPLAGHAQISMANVPGVLSWSYSEVLAGGVTPSLASPGFIEPGEGVRFDLRLAFTPLVGSTVPYFGGAGPGTGTLMAWLSSTFDFIGSGGADGSFTMLQAPPLMAASLHALGPSSAAISVSQHRQNPIGVFNSSSTFEPLVSFTWTPQSYEPRVVSFLSRAPLAQFVDLVLIQYGTGQTGLPLYESPRTPSTHTTGPEPTTGPITIVPGPAGVLALVVLAPLLCGRRRVAGGAVG